MRRGVVICDTRGRLLRIGASAVRCRFAATTCPVPGNDARRRRQVIILLESRLEKGQLTVFSVIRATASGQGALASPASGQTPKASARFLCTCAASQITDATSVLPARQRKRQIEQKVWKTLAATQTAPSCNLWESEAGVASWGLAR